MNIFKKIVQHLKYKYWLYCNVNIPQYYYSHKLGNKIHQGPFKGLKYNLNSVGSVLTPKLIGTYEHELSHFFTKDFLKDYHLFIDIGAAEGYYVCGVKYLNPSLQIAAFETEKKGRKQIERNLMLNNLWIENSIEIFGECTSKNLSARLSPDKTTFILCDIEGYEYILLDPKETKGLKYCDILIELHHDIYPDVSTKMRERFCKTHDIVTINKINKQELSSKFKNEFIIKNFTYLSNEFRKNESWLFLSAKTKCNENFNI
ncbi:class I SAM-dependent methyltransferase [Pedobacter cryophilus]|uniref:Methyltransferase FkbM domain-containing protein n=1 Tax=Pedobacter cryophilus TaxID=2571271 RepID=A0A4U1C0Y8_9SPHI|nr:hypothetical protein [Pedobacter cryophilus]TKB98617.1 hypothetical protein FA046_05730 [Pedobacter cryophilus]